MLTAWRPAWWPAPAGRSAVPRPASAPSRRRSCRGGGGGERRFRPGEGPGARHRRRLRPPGARTRTRTHSVSQGSVPSRGEATATVETHRRRGRRHPGRWPYRCRGAAPRGREARPAGWRRPGVPRPPSCLACGGGEGGGGEGGGRTTVGRRARQKGIEDEHGKRGKKGFLLTSEPAAAAGSTPSTSGSGGGGGDGAARRRHVREHLGSHSGTREKNNFACLWQLLLKGQQLASR